MSDHDMLDCNDVMRRLWDYLDGELDEARRAQVAAHLETCRRCHPHLVFERSFLDAVARVQQAEPGASAELRERIRAMVERETGTGS
jgi:anti-sigma factor (TIGR02949 family)